jgi:hypothetical protein
MPHPPGGLATVRDRPSRRACGMTLTLPLGSSETASTRRAVNRLGAKNPFARRTPPHREPPRVGPRLDAVTPNDIRDPRQGAACTSDGRKMWMSRNHRQAASPRHAQRSDCNAKLVFSPKVTPTARQHCDLRKGTRPCIGSAAERNETTPTRSSPMVWAKASTRGAWRAGCHQLLLRPALAQNSRFEEVELIAVDDSLHHACRQARATPFRVRRLCPPVGPQ